MMLRNLVRKNEYRDSVILMKASEALGATEGVSHAALLMGTDANKGLLRTAGLLTEEGRQARAGDLIVAVQAVDHAALAAALDRVGDLLVSGVERTSAVAHRLLDSAVKAMPDANLAVISVPGRFAGREARKALERGLHVFLFSDGVSLQEEVELKAKARERGLLVMGPECGTAIISNVGIGFANAVRPGPIGLVAASGTGLQEVSVLIHRAGLGVSQAIGVGGRDLWDEVGGISTLQALDALDADAGTEAIVLLSKAPSEATAEKVLARAAMCSKPVVVQFLGQEPQKRRHDSIRFADTLQEAAQMAVDLAGGVASQREPFNDDQTEDESVESEVGKLAPGQKYVRGLFSGGTLCGEAMWILRDYVGSTYSNAPLSGHLQLPDVCVSQGHTLIDMGTSEFTQGRPHPMIDPSQRQARILDEVQDEEVAVLLLDIVLGFGCHPDPAGAMVAAIMEARRRASQAGRYLSVVASVCGTDDDLQNRSSQESLLRDAQVVVMPSNAQASRLAGLIARQAA